jgi:hypothetical protein
MGDGMSSSIERYRKRRRMKVCRRFFMCRRKARSLRSRMMQQQLKERRKACQMKQIVYGEM